MNFHSSSSHTSGWLGMMIFFSLSILFSHPRYNAYMRAKMSGCVWKNGTKVPPVPYPSELTFDLTTSSTPGPTQEKHSDLLQFIRQSSIGTNSYSKVMAQSSFKSTEPDVQLFPFIDPGLVFLCYRGYNHCLGKLSSRSFK